jgi:hypothetical protein
MLKKMDNLDLAKCTKFLPQAACVFKIHTENYIGKVITYDAIIEVS